MKKFLFLFLYFTLISEVNATYFRTTNIPNCQLMNKNRDNRLKGKPKTIDTLLDKIKSNANVCGDAVEIEEDNSNKNTYIDEQKSFPTTFEINRHKRRLLKLALKSGIKKRLANSIINDAKPLERSFKASKKFLSEKIFFDHYLSIRIMKEKGESIRDSKFLKQAIEEYKYKEKIFSNIKEILPIDIEVLIAIWKLETKYGSFVGNTPVRDSLFTLSMIRGKFFEKNFISFLKLVQLKHIKKDVIGSFDGGIGNFQFMPTTLLSNGLDGDGDGKMKIFDSFTDSAFSAANLIVGGGWKKDGGFLTEVKLPRNFDYCTVGIENEQKSLDEWIKMGIKPIKDGLGYKYFDDKNKKGWVVIPDKDTMVSDIDGKCVPSKAFVVYDNYKVVMKNYNNNLLYAATVGVMFELLKESGQIK